MIAVGILRAEETNVITVVESVKSTLKNIQKNIPHSVTVRTLLSEKEVIESGTNSLIQAMIFGLFFSMLVVFAFLGSLRLSLVVLLVVLVAMLAAITAVVYGNLSVNLLTLTSLIILICMVVDDTIIVIENYVYYSTYNKDTNLFELFGK